MGVLRTVSRMPAVLCPVLLCAMLLGGCGSTVKSSYAPTFQPALGTSVRMGAVVDAAPVENRGEKQDFDIESEMRQQLEKHLAKQGLLAEPGSAGPVVEMTVRIENYEPGNAFARWLVPGLGATKLSVECVLTLAGDGVGTITVDRSVAIGGGYTIGEWKEVFEDVARNIAKELNRKLRA